MAATAGSIDISFNLISLGDVHGTPLAEMPEDFERPVRTTVRTQFPTSRAAARHMIRQGSGVILFFGGDGGRNPIRDYYIGGFQSPSARSKCCEASGPPSLGRMHPRSDPAHRRRA